MGEQANASVGRPAGLVQLVGGLAIALLSACMLAGGFLLSQMDVFGLRPTPTQSGWAALPTATPFLPTLVSSASPIPASPTPSPTTRSSVSPSRAPSSTALPSAVPTGETISPMPSISPTPTKTPAPTPTPTPPNGLIPTCTPPEGWTVYTIQRGDTLSSLAYRSGTTVFSLMQANCLTTQAIIAGQKLYLPGTFYTTPTPRPYTCGPPLGWTYLYRVNRGDTLYSLSRRFFVSMEAIRRANCLTDYRLYAGQMLYMPPPPPTLIPFPTVTPSLTPTSTPTLTPSPSATFTPSPSSTSTATPTPTHTPAITVTVTPTATPTLTLTPGPTLTPTTTVTPTLATLATSTETSTATPTETPDGG